MSGGCGMTDRDRTAGDPGRPRFRRRNTKGIVVKDYDVETAISEGFFRMAMVKGPSS